MEGPEETINFSLQISGSSLLRVGGKERKREQNTNERTSPFLKNYGDLEARGWKRKLREIFSKLGFIHMQVFTALVEINLPWGPCPQELVCVRWGHQ